MTAADLRIAAFGRSRLLMPGTSGTELAPDQITVGRNRYQHLRRPHIDPGSIGLNHG
jgi:hypothetical protein